jgi:hypothetical protein
LILRMRARVGERAEGGGGEERGREESGSEKETELLYAVYRGEKESRKRAGT